MAILPIGTPMPPAPEPERPALVTWIGSIWLVASVLLALRGAVNLAVFLVLSPTIPALLQTFGGRSAERLPLLQPLLRHFPEIQMAQIAAWAFVAIAAVAFLRLRPWARRALRIVCWLNLAYIVVFTVLWVTILQRAESAGAPQPKALRTLVVGLAILIAIAAALVAMIVRLGSARIRAAFGEMSDPAAPAPP